ncbi:MAG: LamG-like jellyroll fold domain-containing protein [Pseudomonadota bacterium]
MNYKKNFNSQSKQRRLGFSLLELSIVLIIISMLMVAVIKGSDLIGQAKLVAARQKTVDSPVLKIKGLVLWLETTLPNSFLDSETIDGGKISTWQDSSGNNPNSPNNATQNTVANKPTYVTNGINDLPSLQFNGTPTSAGNANFSYFQLANGATLSLFSGNVFTAFIVYKLNIAGTAHYFIGHQNGWTRWRIHANGFQSNQATGSFTVAPTAKTSNIVSLSGTDLLVSQYQNGAANGTIVKTTGSYTEDNPIWIGGAEDGGFYSLQGMISEIIIFNRTLSNQERRDIEQYLSNKYQITVS